MNLINLYFRIVVKKKRTVYNLLFTPFNPLIYLIFSSQLLSEFFILLLKFIVEVGIQQKCALLHVFVGCVVDLGVNVPVVD